MRIISVLAVLVAMSSSAAAEAPGNTAPVPAPKHSRLDASPTYVGAGATLTSGLSGKGEFGAVVDVAPIPNLELEVGTVRHDVHGHMGLEYHPTWLISTAARAKLPLRRGALFAGFGVITGEHANANGCTASGFIDFCGGVDTYVNRHWDRAVFLTPEFGGELALGPVALRMSVAPVIDASPDPDYEEGCLACDDGGPEIVFNIGLHGRVPMF